MLAGSFREPAITLSRSFCKQTTFLATNKGGSIATYATNAPRTEIPFWQLVFSNARVFFIGSDDVPTENKLEGTRAVNEALEAGWRGLGIAVRFPLDEIAQAHESVERPARAGRTIVTV
jgi:NADPH:quinone reductase